MEKGTELGMKELIIGMPHRGRLNVLANIMRKPFFDIFSEFEGVEYVLFSKSLLKTSRNPFPPWPSEVK